MERARGYRRQPELVLPNPRQVGAGKEGSRAEALPCPCRLHLYWHRDLSCLGKALPHVTEGGRTGDRSDLGRWVPSRSTRRYQSNEVSGRSGRMELASTLRLLLKAASQDNLQKEGTGAQPGACVLLLLLFICRDLLKPL